MKQKISLQQIIPTHLAKYRLDQALAQLYPQYSRSQFQQWIKAGYVKLDHEICTELKHKVKASQTVEIEALLKPTENWTAQAISLDIVYEDEDVLVVNKPVGLVVHPGAGNPDRTLVNALLHHEPKLAVIPRAGVIHRLDKDTSGLLLITKTLSAHHVLTQALKNRTISREYLALVKGALISGGSINAPIGRDPRHRTRMAVISTGKEAITHYRVLKKFTMHTLLEVKLETGRTHQIRVHMNFIRHPIIGDPLYGKAIAIPGKLNESVKEALRQFPRQALHAFKLSFMHPTTQKELQFQIPMPSDMEALIHLLENENVH